MGRAPPRTRSRCSEPGVTPMMAPAGRQLARDPVMRALIRRHGPCELKGPRLNLMSPQSDLAPALLRAVQDILEDAGYVASLKRHYAMFKQALRAPAAKRRWTIWGGQSR